MHRAPQGRSTFGSWDVEKAHAVMARSAWCKKLRVRSPFGRSDVVSCGRCKGLCTLLEVSKMWELWGSFNYNRHYSTLRYIPLHYKDDYDYNQYFNYINYTALHLITSPYNYNYIKLRYPTQVTFHYPTLQLQLQLQLDYTPLVTRHYTALHSTPLHFP